MRGFLYVFILFFFPLQVKAAQATLQAATFNLWSWGPQIENRIEKLAKLFVDEKVIENSSVIFLQEVLKNSTSNYADELANKMKWNSYFQERVGDSEGLAFVYRKDVHVLEKESLQLKSQYSTTDYRRVALSLQVKDKDFGVLRYVNLHLAHEPFMSHTRMEQQSEVLQWIKELEEKSASSEIILGGDFNTGNQESYYRGEFDALQNSFFRFVKCPSFGALFTWIDFDNGYTENVDHFFVSQNEAFSKIYPSVKILPQVTAQRLSDHNLLLLSLGTN